MTFSLLVEIGARVRGLRAPSIPGLVLPQRAAGQLVAVAALLFVAAPVAVSSFPPPPVHAISAPPVPDAPDLTAVEVAPVLAERDRTSTDAAPRERPTVDYTVKRGDSLWRIAERLLGDGTRYVEIVELNHEILDGRPDFIVPGTVLKVPQQLEETYVVQPGDTLSRIAGTKLGDPMRFPELFEASRDTVQLDGAKLTDPDVIRPGWRITIPRTSNHEPAAVEAPAAEEPPSQLHGNTGTTDPNQDSEPSAPAAAAIAATNPDAADEVDQEAAPSWLLPGLSGAGAILAGGVLVAVLAHRRTQPRYRRPGQIIKPPPPELGDVEKTAVVSGGPMTATMERLDRALRDLAAAVKAEGGALPALATVTLAGESATLHLAEDANVPAPWEGSGSEWTIRLGPDIPDRDETPPYPMLVTVGQDDEDRLHLANLEHVGVLSLSGEPTMTAALARHLAAELVLNPWSLLVHVDTIGVGEELAALDDVRLRYRTDRAQILDSIATELEAAADAGCDDPDPFRVVISSGDSADRLAKLIGSPVPRLGAALVTLESAPASDATVFEVTTEGRIRCAALALDLTAAGLSAEEAAACAAIVDLTRESEPVPAPAFADGAEGWRALADQAGALREDLTTERGDGDSDTSVLPDSTETYVAAGATTAPDVERLAPAVPEETRRAIEEADPALDEDVAAWFAQECPLPRLTLLGPVDARTRGAVVQAITKRKPYFVELLAFLALHPAGVTGSAVADAFSISASRARTDLGYLRKWLGTNPRTGREHLPPANASPSYQETGVKTYEVEDVLVDADLFRRLRARAEARGPEGMDDLKAALRLVHGLPFDHLRERGWSWLLDGDRLHETIACAIVDTAHIVVLGALAKGDLETARHAAETACRAAPYDDICHLDLARVTAMDGNSEAADQMLTDVFNRSDDRLPPIDLSKRTRKLTASRTGIPTSRPKR